MLVPGNANTGSYHTQLIPSALLSFIKYFGVANGRGPQSYLTKYTSFHSDLQQKDTAYLRISSLSCQSGTITVSK